MTYLYIHCGLHKTGTSALQVVLSKHSEQLKAAGLLYPRSCRLDSEAGAHHNLAWLISKDRRYDPAHGTWRDVVTEIKNHSGPAIVSSEDFESALSSAARIRLLVQLADETNKKLAFVIYLRNQVSYFESLFEEMLNYGFGEAFELRAREIIQTSCLRMREWEFQFSYARILDVIASAAPGAELKIGNYHDLRGGSIVADFAVRAGVDFGSMGADVGYRTNERGPRISSLILFHQNRSESLFYRTRDPTALDPSVVAAVELIGEGCQPYSLSTGNELRKEIMNSFFTANEKICHDHELSPIGLASEVKDDSRQATKVMFERFFSFETCHAIDVIAKFLRERRGFDNARRALLQPLLAWWKGESGTERDNVTSDHGYSRRRPSKK